VKAEVLTLTEESSWKLDVDFSCKILEV